MKRPQAWMAWLHPEDRGTMLEFIAEIPGRKSYSCQFRIIQSDGETRWIQLQAFHLLRAQKRCQVVGYLVDITENKIAEQALRDSEARYERAVNDANEGIFDWDVASGEAYSSPRWKQLLGYEDHDLANVANIFFEAIHPDDKAAVQQALAAHFEQHKPYNIEFRLRCKNGKYRWFYSRGQAMWDEAGQTRRMACSITDITERKLADQALRESETRLTMALSCSKAGTWDWHIPTGRVIFNDRWAFMRGYRPEEVEPDISAWERSICPEDLPAVQKTLTNLFENRTDFFRAEYRVLTKAGSWIWIIDRGTVIERDAEGEPVRLIGIVIDITDSKLEVQQQLRSPPPRSSPRKAC